MYNHIGFWSSFIIIGIVFYSIYELTPYMWLFLAIIPFYIFINKIMKNIIMEPRPENIKPLYEFEDYDKYDKYGMPSGHMGMSSYATFFHYFLTKNVYLLLTNGFLTALCAHQRYESNSHTLEQLFVGTFLGGLIAYASIFFMKKYLKRT